MTKIKGRRYNSAVSYVVWTCDEGDKHKEFYQKRNGEFFLLTYNGPDDNEGKITPLTYHQAQSALFGMMPHDEYDRVFKGDDQKRSVMVRLTNASIVKLRREAAKKDTTISDVINRLVKDYL